MKTWTAKTLMAKSETAARKWWLVDAKDQTLGRMATQIANILRGKNKPQFTPHADIGDFVVVINADKVKLSGSKWTEKLYYSHSRFFGSLKTLNAEQMQAAHPTKIVEHAVEGMLPKGRLSNQVIKKLKVYVGSEHPHAAQKPEALNIN